MMDDAGDRGLGCGDSWRTGECRRRRTFSDHYSRANMRELLLKFEDFLRKRVDFGVLFLNLFCQRFELDGLSRFCRIRRGGLRRTGPKRKRDYHPENENLHPSEIATGTFI